MLFNSIIAAALGLALAAFYANKVLSIKVTDEKVEELSASIREGSMAFLKRMYSWISVFVVVLAVLISTLTEWGYPCLLYTSPSPRDLSTSRMPSSA